MTSREVDPAWNRRLTRGMLAFFVLLGVLGWLGQRCVSPAVTVEPTPTAAPEVTATLPPTVTALVMVPTAVPTWTLAVVQPSSTVHNTATAEAPAVRATETLAPAVLPAEVVLPTATPQPRPAPAPVQIPRAR